MTKKTKANQADINTFLDAVKGTKVLRHEKVQLNKSTTPPPPRRYPQPDEIEETDTLPPFGEFDYLPPLNSHDLVTYKLIGVSHKVLRKLQKGQYNVEAKLDLHGMTVAKAQSVVSEFLQDCMAHGVHVALIIHGSGLNNKVPVLKNKLNHWLREVPSIVAFCSASAKHGSHGAMYIMFKRTSTRGHFER